MTPPTSTQQKAAHTPTPWKVMADPDLAGKHPCHDNRWIVAGDTEVNFGFDPRPGNWDLTKGTLICQMRDHVSAPEANAAFIVRACNSHEALVESLRELVMAFPANRSEEDEHRITKARTTLRQATA